MRTILTLTLLLVLAAAVPGALQADGPAVHPRLGSLEAPDGTLATSCELESCGELGPVSDPDGLVAGPFSPFGALLDWLQVLLSL